MKLQLFALEDLNNRAVDVGEEEIGIQINTNKQNTNNKDDKYDKTK